ncbi:SgcJ/EcaC family oxidoreductase [Bradyrhizobium sp. TZ2]
MRKLARAFCTSLVLAATPALAGPADEASAIVDQWSATYSANDRNALVKLYAPDALLLGTTDQAATRGTEEIREYFVALDKGGRKNTIKERDVIVLGPEAVVVAGFYDFARKEQNYEPRPSRFTMVVVKRDGRWMIAHHHSSPRAATRQ